MFLLSFSQRYERRIKVDTRLYGLDKLFKVFSEVSGLFSQRPTAILQAMCSLFRSRANVVGVVAVLQAGRPRVRGSFPAGARKFTFLQNVQTCLELHLVLYPVDRVL